MLAEEWTHEAWDDQQLIEAMKKNNRAAFDKLWRKYEPFVRERAKYFASSLNYQERKDFVEICVNDLGVKVWERMNKANKPDIDARTIRSYLFGCVRNYFNYWLRIRERERSRKEKHGIKIILRDWFGIQEKDEIIDEEPFSAKQFSEMMQCIEKKMNKNPTEKNIHDFEILETILYEDDATIATTAEKYGVPEGHVEYVIYTKFPNVAKECEKKVFYN